MPRQALFNPAPLANTSSGLSEAAGDFAQAAVNVGAKREQKEAEAFASSMADLRVRSEELKSEFEMDPIGYQNALDSYAQGAAQQMSEKNRVKFSEAARRSRDLELIGIRERFEAEQERIRNVSRETSMEEHHSLGLKAAREADLETMELSRLSYEDNLIDMGLPEPEIVQAMKDFDADMMREATLGAFSEAQDKGAFMSRYAERTDIPVEEQQKMLATMTGIIKQEMATDAIDRAEEIEAEAMQKALNASNLAVNVGRGSAGYEDIDRSFMSGEITGAKRTELILKLDSMMEERAVQADSAMRLAEALSGGVGMDPKNKHHRDAVEKHLTNTFGAPATWDDDAKRMAVEMISLVGIVPESTQSYIRTAINSSDPEAALQAADLVARIEEKKPSAIDALAQDDIALAEAVNSNIKYGTSPEQALVTARKIVFASPDEKEARRLAFKEFEHDLELPAGWFDRDAPLEAQAAYKHLAQQHYMLTKDYDLSLDWAKNRIGKTWGFSKVNRDGGFMMAPPEEYYSFPGLDDEWMRNQLVRDFGESAQIFSDGQTFRDGTYGVVTMDENGAIAEVDRWKPDVTLTPEYEALMSESEGLSAQEMIEEAKAFRTLKEQDFEPLIQQNRRDTMEAMVRPLSRNR